MNAPADCRACGVCCFSSSPQHVRLSGDDWARLGLEADHYAHFIGHRAFLRVHDGRCAALEIQLGKGGRRDFHCRIYEIRPQICRDLARGSPACLGEIATKAARVAALPLPS